MGGRFFLGICFKDELEVLLCNVDIKFDLFSFSLIEVGGVIRFI